MIADGAPMLAMYSEADGLSYWGWVDSHHCTPSQLADVFLDRHSDLAALGYGQDWLYVGWYQHMLHMTYPSDRPIAHGGHETFDDYVVCVPSQKRIPLPPPGYARDPGPR